MTTANPNKTINTPNIKGMLLDFLITVTRHTDLSPPSGGPLLGR